MDPFLDVLIQENLEIYEESDTLDDPWDDDDDNDEFYNSLLQPDDDDEYNYFDAYDLYEESYEFFARNKKKNKQEKINPKRYKSSWELSKQDKKLKNIAFHNNTVEYVPSVVFTPSRNRLPISEDEEMALALSMSLNDGSAQFVPLFDHEFDKMTKLSESDLAPCGLSFKLIRELQTRDITPEDYELLMSLEESVKKKTTDQKKLEKLETMVVTSGMEGQCAICMGEYQIDEVLRKLPCNHAYHKECIDHWLQNNSTKCPLDGIEV
jgi:hypothetical protein